MPSAEANELPRLVLDESSIDFRGLTDVEIEQYLDDLNDDLRRLRTRDGHTVACPPMWDGVECLDDCELWQFLCRERDSTVDRDTLLLTYSLLSQCPEWAAGSEVETSVAVADANPSMALSVAYALDKALAGYGVACLVFGGSMRRGLLPVRGTRGEAALFFFADSAALPTFWRHLYAFENVAERDFFTLGILAFPDLAFHPDLSFRGFEGTYGDLRERVVGILGAICDYFAEEYRRCHGLPNEIQASFGRYHVDLSPESPNTRGSEQLMRQRRRDYAGKTFTCEWHAKLEPHRNRIHFAAPDPAIDGKILIGIFVKHLDT